MVMLRFRVQGSYGIEGSLNPKPSTSGLRPQGSEFRSRVSRNFADLRVGVYLGVQVPNN